MENLFPPTIDGTAYIEITHNCNFNCRHCYAECPKNEEMSFNQIKQVAKALKKYRFKKIILTGGEPLLVKHIGKTIDYLKKDFKVILITNGSLIRKTNIDYKKLDGIFISYDGPTEKEYKQLRGKPGLKEVDANIRWLNKQGIRISLGIIISKYNINKVNQLIKKAKSLKVETINVTIPQPFGRALKTKDLLLSPEEFHKIIPKITKHKGVHYESMLCYPKELANDSKEVKSLTLFDKYLSGCAAGKKFIYITPKGFVMPCGYITSDKNLLNMSGNIFKQDLKEIYKTQLFKFFMNRSWESVKGKCKKCSYSIICKGGCPFRAYYLKGDPQLPDPWCMNNPYKNKYLSYKVDIKNFERTETIC